DESPLITDPAVIAVLLEKPVLDGMTASPQQSTLLPYTTLFRSGMYAAPPEIRALEVIARLIAQQIFDVLADEGRSKVACGLETVDDRRRRGEQTLDLRSRLRPGLFVGLARRDVAP